MLIGKSRTHGEQVGEKMDTSESPEETLALSAAIPLILPGERISDLDHRQFKKIIIK